MPNNPGMTLPPPPMNLKVDPAFYRWLQTIYNLFSGNGGINMSFIDQSQLELHLLGEKSHQSLTDILPVANTSDPTMNRHVSDQTIVTMINNTATAQQTANQAQIAAGNAQGTANGNTTSINNINSQIATINSEISNINGQITDLYNRVATLAARNQVWYGTGSPVLGPARAAGDWYADVQGLHIWVMYTTGWVQIV